jgi:hypothetical protein
MPENPAARPAPRRFKVLKAIEWHCGTMADTLSYDMF